MKLSHLLYTFVLIFMIAACNSAQAPAEESSEETTEEVAEQESMDMSDMEAIDLREYDMDASIQVPNESNGPREIILTESGNIQIVAGKKFGIEIVPFGMTPIEKKRELADDLVYVIEYLEESQEALVYTKTIKDGDIESEIHFFFSTEINGEMIEIKNIDGMKYKRSAIEKMLASARSIQPSSGI